MEQGPHRGRNTFTASWPVAMLALALSACGGGGEPPTAEAQATAPTESPAALTRVALASPNGVPPAGRLLASNCFQCHGTGGTGGFEEIRGKSANELLEYQRKSASRNIMAAHIQGYTAEQLQQIAAYLK